MTIRMAGRRGFLGGIGAAAGLGLLGCGGGAAPGRAPASPPAPGAAPGPDPGPDASEAFATLERRLGGRLGVVAIHGTSGEVLLAHRADDRFAMCSTFKAPLAACVLQRIDRGELARDARLPLREEDLLDHAPVARARLAEGSLPVEDLCAAVIEVSDNTAANLLLAQVGGPTGFTAFLRGLGDAVTRLDRDEPSLNTNLAGDPRDTTSPRAMAATMRAIALGDGVLSAASRERLVGWMIASRTGLSRLRAGLPERWRIGDKTGTGERGAANDVAIAWPPDGAPIVIACFVDAAPASPDARNAAHAEVGRMVAAMAR